MADYELIYWPIPFRGQFVRAVLAHVGASWTETDIEGVIERKNAPVAQQACPHMGPPMLVDRSTSFAVSQTQAILTYLGRKYGLLPTTAEGDAMTQKIIADANDVLCNMTRDNGNQMWTAEDWAAFQPRLKRWMAIFEEVGKRNGLTAQAGFLLGTEEPGIADLTTAVLWGTMVRSLPAIRPTLDEVAPALAGLVDRVSALPAQAALIGQSSERYGDLWCTGQIEESLRASLG